MRKKLIAIILTMVMCFGLLTGCSLFTYNNERDYLQVVATVGSAVITGDEEKKYNAEEKKIYKYDLVDSLNSIGSTLINSYGYTAAEAVDYCLGNLISRELVLREAKAQIEFGNIRWTMVEENEVQEAIYEAIDEQLATLRNDILDEHGRPTITVDSSSYADPDAAKDTTYPTLTEEEKGEYDDLGHDTLVDRAVEKFTELKKMYNEERLNSYSDKLRSLLENLYNEEYDTERLNAYSDYRLRALLEHLDLEEKAKPFAPSESSYPGRRGDEDERSVSLEAMRRFMSNLRETVSGDYRLSAAQRTKFTQELNDLDKKAAESDIGSVYPELGDTELIAYLVGDSVRDNKMIDLLEEYITDDVNVTKEDVQAEYDSLLRSQKERYKNASNFSSDVKGGSVDPIVYYPNGTFYYVKHILVPFSDEQTAALDAYKNGQTTGYVPSDEQIDEYKLKLGGDVTGYEHVDGENGKLMKINEILAEIRREMANAGSNPANRARAFERLIYRFNTDDGIFDNELGYAVTTDYSANSGGEQYDTTYMKEFSLAAKTLYENNNVGDIIGDTLDDLVVTDYGVHILYLSKRVVGEETIGLNDYVVAGGRETVYDKLEAAVRNEKINEKFTKWQNEKVGYYFTATNIISRNEKAYKDLLG